MLRFIGCKQSVQLAGTSTACCWCPKRPEPEESFVPQNGQRGLKPTATKVALVCGVFPRHRVLQCC